MKALNIPVGIAILFLYNDSKTYWVDEVSDHRPDLLLDELRKKSIKNELIINNINNKSPISVVKGSTYTVPSEQFISYFGGL